MRRRVHTTRRRQISVLRIMLIRMTIRHTRRRIVITRPPKFRSLRRIKTELLRGHIIKVRSVRRFNRLPLARNRKDNHRGRPLKGVVQIKERIAAITHRFRNQLRTSSQGVMIFTRVIRHNKDNNITYSSRNLSTLARRPFSGVRARNPRLFEHLSTMQYINQVAGVRRVLNQRVLNSLTDRKGATGAQVRCTS